MADEIALGADPGVGYGAPTSARAFVHVASGVKHDHQATLAEEVPVAFVYAGHSHAVMMCTPSDLEDLAIGFTLSEGIVATREEIGEVTVTRHSRGIELGIAVAESVRNQLTARSRSLTGRTGCGLCGVEAIDDAVRAVPTVTGTQRVTDAALYRAGASLGASQTLNRDTHSVHAAAWVSADGELLVVREDVGRHNALDKVLGALWRADTDTASGFLLLTSRLSYELIQKAAVAGVSIVAAISRPTGLAVRLGDGAGITLVGLLRGESANVYCHPSRILTS
ncbi:MAG: formate dehydrogenase accessory sulfurtransferase FdhD [Gemmatimonadetes bacterium]|nr:formate dehydrogenase accessory sulfurtransferase FdhD [Gemmatimonadota bacterium]